VVSGQLSVASGQLLLVSEQPIFDVIPSAAEGPAVALTVALAVAFAVVFPITSFAKNLMLRSTECTKEATSPT
jgi:hypothetical protein